VRADLNIRLEPTPLSFNRITKVTAVSKEQKNQYDVLIERMEKLIVTLDIHQGEYRTPTRVDLYWYIQKRQEVELMVDGILNRQRSDLRIPLDELCASITSRLDKDEEQFGRRRSA
jgi:hypothetical protein